MQSHKIYLRRCPFLWANLLIVSTGKSPNRIGPKGLKVHGTMEGYHGRLRNRRIFNGESFFIQRFLERIERPQNYSKMPPENSLRSTHNTFKNIAGCCNPQANMKQDGKKYSNIVAKKNKDAICYSIQQSA